MDLTTLTYETSDRLSELESKIKLDHTDWQSKQLAWEEQAKQNVIAWDQLKPIDPEWGGGLAHPNAMPDNSVLTLGFRPSDGELWTSGLARGTHLPRFADPAP